VKCTHLSQKTHVSGEAHPKELDETARTKKTLWCKMFLPFRRFFLSPQAPLTRPRNRCWPTTVNHVFSDLFPYLPSGSHPVTPAFCRLHLSSADPSSSEQVPLLPLAAACPAHAHATATRLQPVLPAPAPPLGRTRIGMVSLLTKVTNPTLAPPPPHGCRRDTVSFSSELPPHFPHVR
jgi:hypothetical protein